MATVEENLYTLFTGSTAIAAVVGTRVYPVMAPQNATYPCLVYTRVSTPRAAKVRTSIPSFAGRNGAPTGEGA